MDKEIKIIPPEGYEIDKENSTSECIKFKCITTERWRDNENAPLTGYYITEASHVCSVNHCGCQNYDRNYNVFSTEKQAKSALAMARISQIMANDKRFGGPITDEEWNNKSIKHTIIKYCLHITKSVHVNTNVFLAFHTKEQRNLFLEENEDLVKDYLMID